MSTSVKAVLPHLVDAEAVLFHLGDKAFVTRETVRRVIEAGLGQTAAIVVPRWGQKAVIPYLSGLGRISPKWRLLTVTGGYGIS